MPNIETVDELANEIADWVGVYGACNEHHCDEKFCCRIGFCLELSDRIREAVENEKKLDKLSTAESQQAA